MSTLVCPPWCVAEHPAGEPLADAFHCSGEIAIMPPADTATGNALPALEAELMVHVDGGEACVYVSSGPFSVGGAELNVHQVDALLSQLDAYRGRLRELRGFLAAFQGVSSEQEARG